MNDQQEILEKVQQLPLDPVTEVQSRGFLVFSGESLNLLTPEILNNVAFQVSEMIRPHTPEIMGAEAFMLPQSKEDIKLAMEEGRTTLIMDGEEVVGFTKYKLNGVAEIGSVVAKPGEKLFGALIWSTVSLVRSSDYKGEIVAVVGQHNERSKKAFRSLGEDFGIINVTETDQKPEGLELKLKSEKTYFDFTNCYMENTQ